MSAKVEPARLEDLLNVFIDTLAPEDVLCAKVMSQASKAIIRERMNLQMNQKEFAAHIHATQSLVSRWERGDYNFSLKKLSSIAAALDMDIHLSMVPRSNRDDEFTFFKECKGIDWNVCIFRSGMKTMQPMVFKYQPTYTRSHYNKKQERDFLNA